MKATIDAETCVGCGLCADTCPEVYRMENEKAVSIVDVIPANLEESAKKGADDCPVQAIEIK